MDENYLTLIILADTSGSMISENKISALNASIHELLRVLADSSRIRINFQVCVISFGADLAKIHIPLSPVKNINWVNLSAYGKTPLGEAFDLAKGILEQTLNLDKNNFIPIVILVSDGLPTDSGWDKSLKLFLNEGRSAHTDRFALAIGTDAKIEMLKFFVNHDENKIFFAEDASKIPDFFRYIRQNFLLNPMNLIPVTKYFSTNVINENY